MKTALLLLASATCLGFTFLHNPQGGSVPASGALPLPGSNHAAAAIMEGTSDVITVVEKAQAFKALLSSSQISTLQHPYTPALARRWSNLPCGSGCRNGIQFSTLSEAQLTAAKAVIQAAAGTSLNEGYDEFIQIITADSLLGTVSGANYSKGIYFISFLNEPSATGPWMLQYGGHHYAANIAFNKGAVIGATPIFEGVEPRSFVAANGRTYAPIDQEHQSLVDMFASLTSSQLSSARLSATFSDVVLGPNQDGKFPATKVGLPVSSLSDAQKLLVLEAMKPWVNDIDEATAATLLAIYQQELNETYIAWSGSSLLNAHANYARIDGPSVWIEFVCQNGVVFPNQIHYHTIWRDHVRDYGNDLSGSISSVREEPVSASVASVYPNPARDVLTISLPESVSGATISIFSSDGRSVLSSAGHNGSMLTLDLSALDNGSYFLRVENARHLYSGSFTKLR